MNQDLITPEPPVACSECGSPLRQGFEDMTYERDGFTIVVKGVPMNLCDTCGERYVPGLIAVALSDLVAKIVKDIEREMGESPVAIPRRVEYEANRSFGGALALV